MKTYIYLVLTLPLWISSFSVLANPCEDSLVSRVKKGPTASALAEIAQEKDGTTLKYDNAYYPTKFHARSRKERFKATLKDQKGSDLTLIFDLKTRNLEPNGLKPSIWSEPVEGHFYVNQYDADLYGENFLLQFQGYLYKTPFAAPSRFAIFTAILANSDGQKYRLRVRVREKNLQGDGLEKPIWKRQKTAIVTFEPL